MKGISIEKKNTGALNMCTEKSSENNTKTTRTK